MTDMEDRLRAAMHAAVSGEEASAGELIRLVMRRHLRHVALAGGVAVLIALAVAVPVAIALHGALTASGPLPSTHHSTPRPHRLPAKMSGLPMRPAADLKLLISTAKGAAWYSTATRRAEPIAGLPAVSHEAIPSPYKFGRLDGGWWAMSPQSTGSCPTGACGTPPQQFYFIADGSSTATRIGAGYAGDGVAPASRAGAVWLVTYPPGTAKNAGLARAQLVSTAGQPLGPRYTLPAGYLLRRGVGSYLLLVQSTNQNRFSLWDPRTGRVVRRFGNVIAAGPEQIAWSAGCRGCRVQVLNVSTGKTVTTPSPGGQPSALTATISDDGQLIAGQLPGGELSVLDTSSGVLTVIPGTAVSNAGWQNFGWLNGGHRLIVTAGPNSQPGPAQVASWQPGDGRLSIATVRNPGETSKLQTGTIG